MAPLTPQLLAEGHRSLTRAVMRHLDDPNVSLIDVGWRIRDRCDYRIEPQLCVRVHLRQKLRGEAFAAFASRYPHRVVDSRIIGFPVDLPEANYKIHQRSWGGAPTFTDQRNRLFKPLLGGIGIFNPLTSASGTLGAKVIDRETRAEMLLSNWHVLGGVWYAPLGLDIYQPFQSSLNGSNYRIARFSRHAMNQNLDAAVAELTEDRQLINNQLGVGSITGLRSPEIDLQLVKSGRTTGVTRGIITGVGGYRVRYYDGRRQVIRDILHIAQTSEGGQVSSAGDSGSIWLEENTREAVGLHFAGSDDPEYALGLAMPQVLDALNVDLVTN